MINLQKGQTLALSKETSSKRFQIRAGWDLGLGASDVDIDVMAINLGSNKPELVYYNNMVSRGDAVSLSGDNRTGEGEGWDEIITIHADKLDTSVNKVACVVSIYQAAERGQNFGLVRNLKVQIFDETNQTEIAMFEPELDNGIDTALVLGEFVVSNGSLYFKPLGQGFDCVQNLLNAYNVK